MVEPGAEREGERAEVELRSSAGRRVQKVRVRRTGWTAARRKLFLDTLAATCNVSAALRAAGMKTPALYALRRRDAAFSQAWAAALEIGYDRLEGELLRRALEALETAGIDPDASPLGTLPPLAAAAAEPVAAGTDGPGRAGRAGTMAAARAAHLPAEYRLALSLLARRDGMLAGGTGGPARKRMDADEVNALLARKLDALAASRARRRALEAGAADNGGDAEATGAGGAS